MTPSSAARQGHALEAGGHEQPPASPARGRRGKAITRAIAGLTLVAGLTACRPVGTPAAETAPRRIIALAPALTEMLFALDLGDRVVGVGRYAAWPPEVQGRPRLGGLLDADLEAIVELAPDLAVLLPSEGSLERKLRGLGIDTLTVPLETVADVGAGLVALAARCGVPERGERAARALAARLRPRPLERSPTVALLLARSAGTLDGLVVAGPGTFYDTLLERLGARNAFADAPLRYPQVGLEEIVSRHPEVILELQPGGGAAEPSRLLADWADLGAADPRRTACVRVLEGSHLLLPGPRLPRLYEDLRAAIVGCREDAS